MAEAFGTYTLIRQIGRGGMADLFLARSNAGLHGGQVVAIKRLRQEFCSNPVYIDLFTGEADLTRQLRHGAIIDVLETGVIDDMYYITMEYIDGVNIDQLIAAGLKLSQPIPINIACRITHIVAMALQHAHTAPNKQGVIMGVIHSDVTPDNILVSKKGEIRLMDFGIAQLDIIDNIPDELKSAGTVNYLAPEQFLGQRRSPATDVFALGACFYKMLTGQDAFSGDSPAVMWDAVLKQDYIRPSKLRVEICSELEEVIATALNPTQETSRLQIVLRRVINKNTRYSSAEQFSTCLSPLYNHHLAGEKQIAEYVTLVTQ